MRARAQTPLLLALVLSACGDDGGGDAGSATDGSTAQASETGAPTGGGDGSTGAPTGGTSSGEDSSTGASSGEDSSTGAPEDPAWQEFLGAREDHLKALAVPILACVARNDTKHPVFNGCIDWHSAVHGTYALHAISRHTGDDSYRAAAEVKLTPAGLDAELNRVQQGVLPEEIPYGYSWFLTLARERELLTAQTDLVPLATEIRDQLRAWVESRTQAQIDKGVLADDYASITWAALNLWQWAQWTADAELAAAMEGFAADHVLDPMYDLACPFAQEEQNTIDFFPPCLHRARLLVTALAPDQAASWLAGWLPDAPTLTPIDMPAAAHISGLNFSRAWGLWSLYQASGAVAYRDIYLEHMNTHLNHPQYWAEDYDNYAHWVAQFGVYAISQTYAP